MAKIKNKEHIQIRFTNFLIIADQLKVSLELLQNEAPKENGVIVQPVKVKRKVKEPNIKDKIPKRKPIKTNLTGSVGVKAGLLELSSNLTTRNLINPLTTIGSLMTHKP